MSSHISWPLPVSHQVRINLAYLLSSNLYWDSFWCFLLATNFKVHYHINCMAHFKNVIGQKKFFKKKDRSGLCSTKTKFLRSYQTIIEIGLACKKKRNLHIWWRQLVCDLEWSHIQHFAPKQILKQIFSPCYVRIWEIPLFYFWKQNLSLFFNVPIIFSRYWQSESEMPENVSIF